MKTAKRERPILFSGPMVRAILDGRKTQTRRILSRRHGCDGTLVADPVSIDSEPVEPGEFIGEDTNGTTIFVRSPYGVAGDRLWVRETWRAVEMESDLTDGVLFAADASFIPIENNERAADQWGDAYANGKHGARWRPSIYMPRWACRIELEVTAVRVERLHAIGSDGRHARAVLAEGITLEEIEHQAKFFHPDDAPALTFGHLWNGINGKRAPWASNPFVWVVEFKRRAIA